MMPNAGKPWCAKQDHQLLRLARAGKSVAEVAEIMGRTLIGIVSRADRLSYRVTTTDQYTLLRAFIDTARNVSPAATTRATQCHDSGLPLLLEVHTEQFYLLFQAIEAAGFEIKCRANLASRYVVRDTEKSGESV